MKKIILLFVLVCIPLAYALDGSVFVLDFTYSNGEITFNEKIVKSGFAPDRRLSAGDYTVNVIDYSGEILYSFDFDVPNFEFVDLVNNTGRLSGGIVKYDETNFALVVPYFDSAEFVSIFAPDQTLAVAVDVSTDTKVSEIRGNNSRSMFYYFMVGIFVLVILVLLLFFNSKWAKTI